MSDEDTPADYCAICVGAIAGGEVDMHWKDETGTAHICPVDTLELALAWMASGRRIVHRQWQRQLFLASDCIVGGTPVCQAHASYALHLWSRG